MVEMMVVLAFMGTIAAIAIPAISRALAVMRLNGAIRSIADSAALTKTKAATNFTRERLFVDLGASAYHIETWNSGTNQWVVDSAVTPLPNGVTFGTGPVGAPPTNYQPDGINSATPCFTNASPPAAIGNTVCVEFNSRGIPLDESKGFIPTADDAVYITDGNLVLGVTVTATGLIGVWSTPSAVAPSWTTV